MILNFALCTDDNFVVPALVCITSVFENNKSDECRVAVLTDGLSSDAKNKFQRLAQTYGQQIDILEIDSSRFDSMVTRGRYPVSMYYRFLLPELLPEAEKVLYLDCDTMVRRSLGHLFRIDIENIPCAVVVDQQCDDVQIQNRLRTTAPYFNSGVMLMNLVEWRKQHYTDEIIAFIQNNPDICLYPDQDALNYVLGDKVTFLEYGYNLQEMWLTMLDYARFHYSRHEDIERSKINPYIIHFCVGDKPWYKESKNPYRREFLNYANMHGFIGFKERNHYTKMFYRIEAEIQRLKRWQKRFVNK